jgi:hypothetical protein
VAAPLLVRWIFRIRAAAEVETLTITQREAEGVTGTA